MFPSKEFTKLLAASFLSQSGSHFLTIALAAFVLVSTGSLIQGSLVFVLSYLPSVFFSARLGAWIDQKLSKWLLAKNEVLAIACSVLCGCAIYFKVHVGFLCLVVAARSLLLFIARTGGSKWVKIISPPELQGSRIKLYFLSFFLSTAVAGILAATVLSRTGILTVVVLDIGTYLLSLALLLTLGNIKLPATPIADRGSQPSLFQTLAEIWALPDIKEHFVAVCFSQALFQGAYSVLVSYLPILKFRIGTAGIGPFQLAASIGITMGFVTLWVVPRLFDKKAAGRSSAFIATLASGIGCLAAAVYLPSVPGSLLAFFGFNLSYECIWLFHNSEFFRKTPAAFIGRYQFTLTSVAAVLMTAFTFGYSVLISVVGDLGAIGVVAGLGLGAWAILTYFTAGTDDKEFSLVSGKGI